MSLDTPHVHVLDLLVGRTESVAYELAQDAGYVVRIAARDDQRFAMTMEVNNRRVNFRIKNNLLESWYIG